MSKNVQVSLGLGSQAKAVCRAGDGRLGGWDVGVGWRLGGGRLDVGRWRGLSLAAVGSMRPRRQLQEVGSLRGGQVGRLAPGGKGSRGLLWGIDQCSSGRCAVTAFLTCLCLALFLPASGRRTRPALDKQGRVAGGRQGIGDGAC